MAPSDPPRRILAVRMLGLGDVASIGLPAARLLRARHPDAELVFLSHGPGVELLRLCDEVDDVVGLPGDAWPADFWDGVRAFGRLGQELAQRGFDAVWQLDTWFLPCFLGQLFREAGVAFHGNHLRWSMRDTLLGAKAGTLGPRELENAQAYLASTFPCIDDWLRPWWLDAPDAGPYPDYYLRHVCGFPDELATRLAIEPDPALRAAAGDRPLVALAPDARTAARRYPHGAALQRALEAQGLHVWTGFDGSVPLRTTLARLAASDLLVTVASAPQWLARLVACPTLVIPGFVPPETLGADATVPKVVDCQYCMKSSCPEGRDFACMDVPVALVVESAIAQFDLTSAGRGR